MITCVERPNLWLVDGHVVDTRNPDAHAYPMNVLAAVLAHRDAETVEERDMADLLAWSIEEHSPWDGGCASYGNSAGLCDFQAQMRLLAVGYLIQKTTTMIRRYRRGEAVLRA